jgi:hypothetical protein
MRTFRWFALSLLVVCAAFSSGCSDSATAPTLAPPARNYVMQINADISQGGYRVASQSSASLVDGFRPQVNYWGGTIYQQQEAGASTAILEVSESFGLEALSVTLSGKMEVDTSASSPVRVDSYIAYGHEDVVRYAGEDSNGNGIWNFYGDSTQISVTKSLTPLQFSLKARAPNMSGVSHAFGTSLRCVKAGTTILRVHQPPQFAVQYRNGTKDVINMTAVQLIEVTCYAGEDLPAAVKNAMVSQKLTAAFARP